MNDITTKHECVTLAAFSVHADDQRTANDALADVFKEHRLIDDARVECYWIADDERTDGSDNDSAIFVHPGVQNLATMILHELGLSQECNIANIILTDDEIKLIASDQTDFVANRFPVLRAYLDAVQAERDAVTRPHTEQEN